VIIWKKKGVLSFNTLPRKEALVSPLNPQDQSRHTLTFGSCTVREQSVSFIVIMSSSFRANSFLLMGRFRTWGPKSQFLSSKPFPMYQTPTHRENPIQQTNYPERSESLMKYKATWSYLIFSFQQAVGHDFIRNRTSHGSDKLLVVIGPKDAHYCNWQSPN
jgi:hypothetical protein